MKRVLLLVSARLLADPLGAAERLFPNELLRDFDHDGRQKRLISTPAD